MVELKSPGEVRRANYKLPVLDFRRANFALFRDAQKKSPEGKRGPRKLVNIQEPPFTKSGGRYPYKEEVR